MITIVFLALAIEFLLGATPVMFAFCEAAFAPATSSSIAACRAPILSRVATDSGSQVPKNADCPSCRDHKILVTAPEVLAIVDHVQRKLPEPEVQRIRGLAVANAQRACGLDAQQHAAAGLVCPLHCSQGDCAAYAVRPVHCRSWHMLSEAAHDEEARAEFTRMEDGIVQGLNAAGLDGTKYELNSALAVAFQDSAVRGRWAHGESVFAGCGK